MEGAPYRTGDVIAGRYEVKEISGAGPVGFLFRARDKELDVEVAVKVVNARLVQTLEERDQFSRVIRLGRKLSHQNLARVNEDGEERGYPFYTTPFLDGLSLRKIMDLRQSKQQVFTLQEVEPILGQIAAGLASAHKVGPHANLKPENILVLPDLLKITDFGLGAALPRAPFTQAQKTRKVDAYFAPEFLKGGKPDARVDVYAMGVILGEMLTGLVPDEQQPLPELIRKRPELPLGVEGLYRRALNENPQARFGSPNELFQEFCSLVPGNRPKPAEVAPPSPEEPPKRVPTVNFRRSSEKPQVAPAPPPPKAMPGRPDPRAPVDATQPLDASMISAMLAEQRAPDAPADATQPLDASLLPFALEAAGVAPPQPKPKSFVSAPPPAGIADTGPTPTASLRSPKGAPVDATQPMDRSKLPRPPGNPDNSPTMAMDSSALPSFTALGPESPSIVTGVRRRSQSMMWLVLLTAAAGLVGAFGGYLLLEWSRQRPARLMPPGSVVMVDTATGAASGAEGAAGAAADACPAGTALVPAGAFSIGTAPGDNLGGFDERPLSSMELPAFCIDIYEFPNQAGTKPKAGVTWAEAKALCESKGRRLCTEPEWEKACKGPRNARFPYGDGFDASACNTQDAAHLDRPVAEAGQFARCKSGYGVMDLSGNVAEWTASSYAKNADMTQKGGAFDRPDYAARCSARRNGAPTSKSPQVGFRCCVDARG